jgi:hypothetical protein
METAMAGERLVNMGLVKPGQLSVAFKKWLDGAAPLAWELNLFAAAILEFTLGSLESAPDPLETGAEVMWTAEK